MTILCRKHSLTKTLGCKEQLIQISRLCKIWQRTQIDIIQNENIAYMEEKCNAWIKMDGGLSFAEIIINVDIAQSVINNI